MKQGKASEWYEQEIERILSTEYHPGDEELAQLRATSKNSREVLEILILARDQELEATDIEVSRPSIN